MGCVSPSSSARLEITSVMRCNGSITELTPDTAGLAAPPCWARLRVSPARRREGTARGLGAALGPGTGTRQAGEGRAGQGRAAAALTFPVSRLPGSRHSGGRRCLGRHRAEAAGEEGPGRSFRRGRGARWGRAWPAPRRPRRQDGGCGRP